MFKDLFTRKNLIILLVSCVMLFLVVGKYNTVKNERDTLELLEKLRKNSESSYIIKKVSDWKIYFFTASEISWA